MLSNIDIIINKLWNQNLSILVKKLKRKIENESSLVQLDKKEQRETWRRGWRKAFAENGGEEFVSAVSDEPLSGINELREPTVVLVRVSEGCRRPIVRRWLCLPERFFSKLAKASAAFVTVLVTRCRHLGERTVNELEIQGWERAKQKWGFNQRYREKESYNNVSEIFVIFFLCIFSFLFFLFKKISFFIFLYNIFFLQICIVGTLIFGMVLTNEYHICHIHNLVMSFKNYLK